MADTRCDTTDLLVEQCACPQHRGGRTPQEEASAEQAHPAGNWFEARYAGVCAGCGDFFPAHVLVHRVPPEFGTGYVAQCCAQEVS